MKVATKNKKMKSKLIYNQTIKDMTNKKWTLNYN